VVGLDAAAGVEGAGAALLEPVAAAFGSDFVPDFVSDFFSELASGLLSDFEVSAFESLPDEPPFAA
jgi:hypothetical protein